MTNPIHLLLTPHRPEGASALMQGLARRYVQYANRFYKRSGTLWEGRFKASAVQADVFLLQCYRYIELNPLLAGMVAHPRDYQWASYRHHVMETVDETVSDHPLYLALDAEASMWVRAYAALFRAELADKTLTAIRTASRPSGFLEESASGKRSNPQWVGDEREARREDRSEAGVRSTVNRSTWGLEQWESDPEC